MTRAGAEPRIAVVGAGIGGLALTAANLDNPDEFQRDHLDATADRRWLGLRLRRLDRATYVTSRLARPAFLIDA
jgi:hypothetical protein